MKAKAEALTTGISTNNFGVMMNIMQMGLNAQTTIVNTNHKAKITNNIKRMDLKITTNANPVDEQEIRDRMQSKHRQERHVEKFALQELNYG